MNKILVLAAPLALMAACSSGGGSADADGDGEISQDEAAAEAASVNLQPGAWESTMRFTEFEMPDMPEEMRAMMREQIGRTQSNSSCITPEQAANPEAGMFNDNNDSDCTYSDFTMSGGNILITAQCTGGDTPGSMTMHMEGSYTPTTYEMAMTMDMEGMPTGPMHVAGEISARRTGECDDEAEG